MTKENAQLQKNSQLRIFTLLKKIIHRASEHAGELGQKNNIGVAFFPLPFGDSLRRNAEQRTELLLRQAVRPAICFDLLKNDNFPHIRYTSQ